MGETIAQGCAGCKPKSKFRALLTEYARPVLHGPFNLEARRAAGFDAEELEGLIEAAERRDA